MIQAGLEVLLKTLLESVYHLGKRKLAESGSKLVSVPQDTQEFIQYHLHEVDNWSGEVKFRDIKGTKLTEEIFVPLDLLLRPMRTRIGDEKIETISLRELFDHTSKHVIILGQPGAGKTTSMKHFCQLLLHDDSFCVDKFNFPIVIRLREMNRGTRKMAMASGKDPNTESDGQALFNELETDAVAPGMLIREIQSIMGLQVKLPKNLLQKNAAKQRETVIEKLVVSFLSTLKVLLILDGLDEITDERCRWTVVEDVRTLALNLTGSTLVLTSRTGEFSNDIDMTALYEIAPLTDENIETFAMGHLGNKEVAKQFVIEVRKSPFADTTIRPLTLAHLCAIYERVGKIPEQPADIYSRVVNLLLQDWDEQRGVRRVSRYAQFEVDRKRHFLGHVSYLLTTQFKATTFSKGDLRAIYDQIYMNYGLDRYEAQQVVNELETHTGLLIQSGYEQFEFAHKSLQEYLTAEYIVRLPEIPPINVVVELPYELAVAVSISSMPSDYLSVLTASRLLNKASPNFYTAFVSRLILERPNFNMSDSVGLAFITLYTDYIRAIDFQHDSFLGVLEDWVSTNLSQAAFNFVHEYYEFEPISAVIGRETLGDLACMTRRPRRVLSHPLAHMNLPSTIFIKTSFFHHVSREENDRK